MISVRELSFSYGSRRVLNGISLEAKPGELVCVLGRNGAGKTTLFKCILGLLNGYTGEVLIDGENIMEMDAGQRARRVAYIPQANRPAFAYSVIDMVLMGTGARLTGMTGPAEAEYEAAEQALNKLGIGDLAERDYTRISGGEQQMVLIARALVQGARTLIMDEPTTGLDYGNQMRVQKQMRQLAAEGYTVLQSSHHPEQTYMFADRILCIKDGKVFREGTPQNVMDEMLIRELYGLEVRICEGTDGKARFFEPV